MLALTACTFPGSGKEKENGVKSLDREEAGSLKVAYFQSQAFFTQYGNAFQAMFPKVEIEVISTESVTRADDPVAEMQKLVDSEQPDVLVLPEAQYEALAKDGRLYDLEAVIKQSKFDIDSFHPAVIDLLKSYGGGKLYGLSPSFSSQALYYNKSLFDQYKIDYPKDGMSWEEVLQLAARFPVKKGGDNALYGLSPSMQSTDAFALIRMIGEAKGLAYADSDSGTVSINTPEWKEIFKAVTDGYKTGVIQLPSSGGGGDSAGPTVSMMMEGSGKSIQLGPDSMRFMSGQSAMAIDGPILMNMLGVGAARPEVRKQNADPSGKGEPKAPGEGVVWDVVTVPVDRSRPDVAGGMSLDNVFAINAASNNLAAAWELVKYINGEQVAKMNAKSSSALSSRTAHATESDGKNIGAFYALGIDQQSLLQTLPEGFAESFAQMASEHIQKIVNGTASLDEAMKAIQSQGQDLLTKAKQ